MEQDHPDYKELAARNAKHRNELADRLDRLMDIAKKLEQRKD